MNEYIESLKSEFESTAHEVHMYVFLYLLLSSSSPLFLFHPSLCLSLSSHCHRRSVVLCIVTRTAPLFSCPFFICNLFLCLLLVCRMCAYEEEWRGEEKRGEEGRERLQCGCVVWQMYRHVCVDLLFPLLL